MAEQFPAIVVGAVVLAAAVAVAWTALRRMARAAVRVAAAVCILAALALWALLAGGCAAPRPAESARGAPELASITVARSPSPAGVYDVTMASPHMSESGVMEIRGWAGGYSGEIRVGSFAARITGVEPGRDHMTVTAETERGTLILRLARNGPEISGNWILGPQRGTLAGRARGGQSPGGQSSGGPSATGKSSRPPHSDQLPS